MFSTALQTLLTQTEADISTFNVEANDFDDEDISSRFYHIKNGDTLRGFGTMYRTKNKYSAIWLVPTVRGFSKSYIDKFSRSISKK